MENPPKKYKTKRNEINKRKIKKYNRALNVLMALIFISFITVIILFNVLKIDKTFSEEENRVLATIPKFTIKSFLSGDFVEDYTKYVEDNFAGRKGFVSIKTNLEKLSGKTEINSVFIGKDGQLFEKFEEGPEEESDSKIATINSFSEKYKK